MEVARSSERSVAVYQSKGHNIPENLNFLPMIVIVLIKVKQFAYRPGQALKASGC
jgi:hypothetical protein